MRRTFSPGRSPVQSSTDASARPTSGCGRNRSTASDASRVGGITSRSAADHKPRSRSSRMMPRCGAGIPTGSPRALTTRRTRSCALALFSSNTNSTSSSEPARAAASKTRLKICRRPPAKAGAAVTVVRAFIAERKSRRAGPRPSRAAPLPCASPSRRGAAGRRARARSTPSGLR